jgi:hypothetical protein
MPSSDDAAADARLRLPAAGMRVTAARVAVLGTLGEHPHATVEMVDRLVTAQLGSVSKQAVYDVLCLDCLLPSRRSFSCGRPASTPTVPLRSPRRSRGRPAIPHAITPVRWILQRGPARGEVCLATRCLVGVFSVDVIGPREPNLLDV